MARAVRQIWGVGHWGGLRARLWKCLFLVTNLVVSWFFCRIATEWIRWPVFWWVTHGHLEVGLYSLKRQLNISRPGNPNHCYIFVSTLIREYLATHCLVMWYTDRSDRRLLLWRSTQMELLQLRKLQRMTRKYMLHQAASSVKGQEPMKVKMFVFLHWCISRIFICVTMCVHIHCVTKKDPQHYQL